MKKLLIFGITAMMVLSLAACSEESNPPVEGGKANGTSDFKVGEPVREDSHSVVIDEADGSSDFNVGEPVWEDSHSVVIDEADGTSDFKVGEPNWND